MKTKILCLLSLLIMILTACSAAASQEAMSAPVMPEAEAVEVMGEAPAPSGVVPISNETGSSDQLAVASSGRMVIKDAEIELLISNTDTSLASVTQMASDFGGYIISSQTWFDGGFKYATVRLAVPSDTFETALNNLRILGSDVLRETASGQDVSAEYLDLETRLTNLEATSARVRTFLEAAQTVEEALLVSAELSELEGQIEEIKGQMRYYEGRTAFSTITVFLTPERPPPPPQPPPPPPPRWDPWQNF